MLSRSMMACRKQLSSCKMLAKHYGQYKSMRLLECVNADGHPIPWYTFPALEYLEHLDFSKLSVFEYGSGNSSFWWAARALRVMSVENDRQWYEKIQSNINRPLKDSSQLVCTLEIDKGPYVASLSTPHDIVVIDGRFRKECVAHFVSSDVSSESIMIIFDNADWYPKAIGIIRQKLGWFELDFHGFGPINRYTWTTSIFVNPKRYRQLTYSKVLGSRAGIQKDVDAR